jgi:kynureninase
MSDSDAQIGKRLAELRGDTSQANLAAAMAERGHKWSQATVWSVEAAKRPLRLAEAADVAAILGIEVRELLVQDRVQKTLSALLHEGKRRTNLVREMVAISEQVDESTELMKAQTGALLTELRNNPDHPHRAWIEDLLGEDGVEAEDIPAWQLLREWVEEKHEDEAFLAAEKLKVSRGVDSEAS